MYTYKRKKLMMAIEAVEAELSELLAMRRELGISRYTKCDLNHKISVLGYRKYELMRSLERVEIHIRQDYDCDRLGYATVYPVDDDYYIDKIREDGYIRGFSI